MAEDSSKSNRWIPEEQQFRTALWAIGLTAALFLYVFVVLTVSKSRHTPSDITAGWFGSWGTWAGGLATAVAFLIAAYSIAVSSAHEHLAREEAARIRETEDRAQARLLIIYEVHMPNQPGSYRFFRIDNRSKDLFFDVTVPSVERYLGSGTETSLLTREAFTGPGTVTLEYLPQGELLTPYRTNTADEGWYTEVRVYTNPETPVQFAVHYTDAAGRPWKQHYGGEIERMTTTDAVRGPRKADSVQPYSQVRLVSEEEAAQFMGGQFGGDVPAEVHEAGLEIVAPEIVATWARVTRIGKLNVSPIDGEPGWIHLSIAFAPLAPSPWNGYFREKITEAGFRSYSTEIHGGINAGGITVQAPEGDIARVVSAVDGAVDYANDEFEERDLRAARQALERMAAREQAAAEREARLNALIARFAKPGRAPWDPATPQAAQGRDDASDFEDIEIEDNSP